VVQRCEVFEVLAAGEFPVKAPLAREHRAEARSDLARPRERIDPEDADRPARRYEQRREHLHRGGLPCAVRPEKAEDLARLHDEIDPIHGAEAVALIALAANSLPDGPPAALEDLDQVPRLDRRYGGHFEMIFGWFRSSRTLASLANRGPCP